MLAVCMCGYIVHLWSDAAWCMHAHMHSNCTLDTQIVYPLLKVCVFLGYLLSVQV